MKARYSTYLANKRQYKHTNENIQTGGHNNREISTKNNINLKITDSILSYTKRKELRESMYGRYVFNNNIYILGCGAIGKAMIYMLNKLFKDINPNITVIDKFDLKEHVKSYIDAGMKYIQEEITKYNYKTLLNKLQKDDLIIDCAYGMCTVDFILLCQEKECRYICSAVDQWDYKNYNHAVDASLHNKIKNILNTNKSIQNKNFNAVIAMGANPGNVSIWTKLGLDMINHDYKHKYNSYAELAEKLKVQTIHISERDGQLNTDPKKPNEYCNTWSTDGESYYEEALGFSEGSWGTHELTVPINMMSMKDNLFALDKISCFTQAQSYVPLYGTFVGNIIPHEESITIGNMLTVKEDGNIRYKPSVYYVYHPCNDARQSLEEMKEKNYEYQKYYRLLTNEISTGRDELGVTFFLENGDVYWIGSLMSVEEARDIYGNEYNKYINATIVQVIAGYVSGILYMLDLAKNPANNYNGVMFAEDLPYKEILRYSFPFLGDFVFRKIKDFSLYKYDTQFTSTNKKTNIWQFANFIIS